MSEAYICDQCQTAAPAASIVNWWRLSRLGIDARTFTDAFGDMTFCSLACLIRWAS